MTNGYFSPLFDAGLPFLTPMESGVVVLIIAILFIALLSTAGYFPVLLAITSYTPVVARIKAKGVPFIEYDRLMELLQSGSLPDCISRLKNAGYLRDINPDGSSEEVEEEILTSWYKETALLRSESPRDAWIFFDAYHIFQDIARVKRIIRLVKNHRVREIAENPVLWPDGFTSDLAMKVANAETVNECARFLQETRYGTPLMDALVEYEKEGSFFYLDYALDCLAYDELYRQASKVMTYLASPYREFFAVLADIENVRTLLRAKHTGRDPDAVPLCLLPGGSEIPSWRLVQLNEMMSVPDIIRQLSGTKFESVLTPVVRAYPSADSMFEFDIALDRLEFSLVSKLSLDYYHSGGPLLWYLVSKEFELRNIRIIVSGLSDGLSSDVITRMLVFQGGDT
ncbi:MAG: V-type ATPase subunit [Methanomicrobiales archaeon]|nr:V-type ATPase subunit [Methanomicrobiales archaeon]